MNDREQRKAAREFAAKWAGKGYEKGESQLFWITLLHDVFGVEDVSSFIEFEDQVHLDHTSFIDGYIPSTKVLIEQKSLGKDLNKGIKQSDGSVLNPFQQAKRYITELPLSRHPRWVVTCNFEEFYVYDMERPGGEPEKIKLADLEKEVYRLSFLTERGSEHLKREMEISIKAGEVVGLLYDALLKQYKNPEDPETLKSLNKLCVRLVFCLYAEDAGIFGLHMMFHDYLAQFSPRGMRKGLQDLFKVLDQRPEEREEYLADDDPLLAAFPYVNGGLFADEDVEIPPFSEEIRSLLLRKASADFDWSEISPTIFGAVFESTLNPETRRSGGMHYTSIENIHKVIDPLFLDELKAELAEIKAIDIRNDREKRLRKFQDKLASLEFLDPAAGSGNFLTESYLCLRRLENEVLLELARGQAQIGDANFNPIRVSISQFHGIEINDFAVTVAKTALWIAESQMLKETEDIVLMNLDFLPLKTNANIVEANALRIDWNEVVDKSRLSYIMGNPPFVGLSLRTNSQQKDMDFVFEDNMRAGRLDYVAAWYKKASIFTINTQIEIAFVSTNSICQGEQVPILWDDLLNRHKIFINFAYRPFVWTSEAKEKAAVHCVIIGLSHKERLIKYLFEGSQQKKVSKINGYLVNAENIFISLRGKAKPGFPKLVQGNKPWDGGYLILSEDERNDMIEKYPQTIKMIRKYIGAYEFINNKVRYCLWLKNIAPNEYRNIPEIIKRLEGVAQTRQNTKTVAVQAQAETPMLFSQIRQPETDYILIPETSSSNRKYIPMGFMSKDIIASNSTLIATNADLFLFGLLTSNVHMAWMRTVCGRLKSDYRYSPSVYNNFPWPNLGDCPFMGQSPHDSLINSALGEQSHKGTVPGSRIPGNTSANEMRAKIEQTAQGILDARAKYPDSSLADLYDELTMPPQLRTAHQHNDRAVMQAYGFPLKMTESECVAELMRRYQQLTQENYKK